jgi:hypothetical protein
VKSKNGCGIRRLKDASTCALRARGKNYRVRSIVSKVSCDRQFVPSLRSPGDDRIHFHRYETFTARCAARFVAAGLARGSRLFLFVGRAPSRAVAGDSVLVAPWRHRLLVVGDFFFPFGTFLCAAELEVGVRVSVRAVKRVPRECIDDMLKRLCHLM